MIDLDQLHALEEHALQLGAALRDLAERRGRAVARAGTLRVRLAQLTDPQQLRGAATYEAGTPLGGDVVAGLELDVSVADAEVARLRAAEAELSARWQDAQRLAERAREYARGRIGGAVLAETGHVVGRTAPTDGGPPRRRRTYRSSWMRMEFREPTDGDGIRDEREVQP